MGNRAVSAACAAALAALGIAFAPAPALAKFGKQFNVSRPYAAPPQVASNARGDTIVVWRETGNGANLDQIRARFRPAGGSFGAIESIRTAPPGSHGLSDPKVGIDGAGNAVIAWLNANQNGGTESVVEAGVRSAGGASDFWIVSGGDGSQACGIGGNPQVAVNARGDAVVAFDGAFVPCNDSTIAGLNLAQISLGSTQGGFGSLPQSMNVFTGVDPNNPTPARDTRAAIDASGNWLAVWDSFPNSNGSDVEILRRGPDSEFPKGITGVSTGKSAPQIAMDGVGNAIVVWTDSKGVEARSRSAGVWGKIETIVKGDLHDASAAFDANATDGEGNAVAGTAAIDWLRNGATGSQLEARIRPAGGTFGRTRVLSASGDLAEPQLAIAGQHIAAAWDNRSVPTNVQAVTGSTAGRFSQVQNLSPAGQFSDFPGVAVDAAGDTIAVWRNTTNNNQVQGATSPSR